LRALITVKPRWSITFCVNQDFSRESKSGGASDGFDGPQARKGITIRAENAAFRWNGYRIDIVDILGHADFGAEVERIMFWAKILLTS